MVRVSDKVWRFWFCVLLFLLSGCDSKVKVKPFQDPYLDAYRGKGILYMTSGEVYNGRSDSIFFDREGNLVEQKSFGKHIRREYDSLRFIVREMQLDDTPKNYLIRYYFIDDATLVQEWTLVKDFEWEISDTTKKVVERNVVFSLDEKGYIVTEIDTAYNIRMDFKYDAGGRLVVKERYNADPVELWHIWTYRYGEDGQLDQITLDDSDGPNLMTIYYKNGLPDSVTHDDGSTNGIFNYTYY
jgi:hypothetical protein